MNYTNLLRIGGATTITCCLLSLQSAMLLAAGSLRTFVNDAGIFDPAGKPVEISYQLLDDTKEVLVRIRDYQGHIVHQIYFTDQRAGDYSFTWNGKGDDDQQLPDGRYQLVLDADFQSGFRETAAIDVRIATLGSEQKGPLPEPLPPKEYHHKISGSLSGYAYYEEEESSNPVGESRFRTSVEYNNEIVSARGVFAAIQDFSGEDPTFDGTQARVEGRWEAGLLRGVYRESLGTFDDPMQLFSDFKTERDKIGAVAEHSVGPLNFKGLLFAGEDDDDNQEEGMAVRMTYGSGMNWHIGTSYTFRKGIDDFDEDEEQSQHAGGIDLSLPVSDSLLFLAQLTGTENGEGVTDAGYQLRTEYNLGGLQLAAGYINLGENFTASFADPLHGIDSDAEGFEAGIDYIMIQPLGVLKDMSASFRFFSLTQHSDNGKIDEIDGSLRFGVGEKDSLFFSLYTRDDEYGSNISSMGSITHKWSETYSSSVQLNYSETDTSNTIRTSIDTSYSLEKRSFRVALEWLERTIDYSKFSPYHETNLRLDLKSELWAVQLQGKYSKNSEEDGWNVFGRFEYKPIYLHRYNILTYVSIGRRSAIEFEEQIECGVEVQF